MVGIDHVRNSGSALIEIFRADGSYTALQADNLVVDSGLAYIAGRTLGEYSIMSHMAMGSNSTAVANWNTGLYSELPGSRVGVTTSRSGSVVTYTATFGPNVGTGTVAELGIFNAASGGTMLNRVAFTPQQKGSQDTFKVTWSVTQSA